MATTDANGFITVENSDLFNISHANGNAAAASAVATRVTTAEVAISDIQTALGNKVDTSTYTAGMATKVNSSTYTAGMATKVDKVDGKGLSTEDYTSTEKTKLAGIAAGANNYSLPEATTSTLGGVIVGSGLSVASGVVSAEGMTITHSTTPFSKIKIGANDITSSCYTYADAYIFGDGTDASPALCHLQATIFYSSFAANDSVSITLNGFNSVYGHVYAVQGNRTNIFEDSAIKGVCHIYNASTLYLTFSDSASNVSFDLTFPVKFTS